MVKVKKDLTGETFGLLTVVCQAEDFISSNGEHRPMWLCKCSCGNEEPIYIRSDSLTTGHTKSCGCLASEHAYQIGKNNQRYNKYDLSGEHGVLWAENTDEEVWFDLEYADKILQYNWSIGNNGYPFAYINRKRVTMHSFIGCSNYDHANRNKLDNRKENLRKCTVQENSRNGSIRNTNQSGFIGVGLRKDTGRWYARITIDGKGMHLGYFIDKNDAIKARLEAEVKYFGEFAPQSHLFEEYGIEY